jgi:hypothetical protein
MIVYERYKWIMSLDVLFHFEMNMIEMLLINHYDSTKSKKSINRFHLKTHVEFWNRKKIRLNNWDFHIAQKLILQSYCRYISTWMNLFTESAMIRPTLSARIANSFDSTYHSSTSSDDFVNDLINDSFTNHWSSHWSHHRTSLSDNILWLCDESTI